MSSVLVFQRQLALSWVEIDLAAIRQNFRLIRSLLRPETRLFAVVKADAYGHGAVEVSRVLLEEKAELLCVARVEEAFELRQAGIDAPVLIFAPPFAAQAEGALAANAAMTVCTAEHIECVAAAAASCGHTAHVHLKLDTGMGRLGAPPQHALELCRAITASPYLELEGVMSHLSSADMQPPAQTLKQLEAFRQVRLQLLDSGISVRYFHLSNSAGAMDYPEAQFDAVRAGIAVYGQYPSPDMERRIELRPAMTMKSRMVFLKSVPSGAGLSYGHTFVTSRPSVIATVPLGYADGYPRHASNRASMLVRGRLAPVVGRVCMDQTLLDVTDIPGVEVGDEVSAFGVAGDAVLRAEDVATTIGTIGYELTTRIGKRLPRFYSHNLAQTQ